MTSELILSTPADLWRFSETAINSGLLPSGVKSAEAAFIIIATGLELKLSPMQSLRGIAVIEGKPVLSAALAMALALRHPLCRYFTLIESNAKLATFETQRGEAAPVRKTWTIEDAQRADLTSKSTWKKYPMAMLEARCLAALARSVYPDTFFGVYIGDEEDDIRQSAKQKQPARPQQPAPRTIEAAPPAALPKAQDPIDEMLTPPKGEDLQEVAASWLNDIEKASTFEQIKNLGQGLRQESEEVRELVRGPFEARWNALKHAAPKLTEGPRSPNPASPRSSATGMRPDDYDQVEAGKTAKVSNPPSPLGEGKPEKPFDARAAVETARATAVQHPPKPAEPTLNREEAELLRKAGEATSLSELTSLSARKNTVHLSAAASKAIDTAIAKRREVLTKGEEEGQPQLTDPKF
jgi:hypothetical protein